ncbi:MULTISPECIES: ABC transporter ATP-binding protein [Megasphaera]|uniref:Macrolide ABC transporter ATP-binding protein n=1 Tax=Megasphaera hutchinsoni TaxID=1588748 RepID=A0A2J8BAT8_9FIRM|nr:MULTISPECIES: ABC transporter ATP-binding protein [Megasphaera]EGS32909.1 ABC transporter, ATP-binding protein [Megasphaera sp. UPII 135-E]PNH21871.1 macrolide ABC transporter ATP-binding protein [Megasphaera genomosp. type_2]
MKQAIITLRDIKKTYHIGNTLFTALHNIHLVVEKGEFTALVGPSGSGKSTLMNILGCLDRPDSGSYQLNGREVAHLSDDELAKTRNCDIGFVFQNFNLLPRISSLANVALPLIYAGVPKKEREQKAAALLSAVGLEKWMHHKPTELSGGQRQRVAIARALIHDPAIIMADEPTGNLDTRSTSEIMDIFESLHRQQKTIILVTHEPEIAARAERRLLLQDGAITHDERKGGTIHVI